MLQSAASLAEDVRASEQFLRYASRFNHRMTESEDLQGSLRQTEHRDYQLLVGSLIKSFQIPNQELVQDSVMDS